jgi:hypothetical protein
MLVLPLILSALAIAQLPSASDHPPIFPGRIDSTDLEAVDSYPSSEVADVAAADMDQDGHIDVLVSRRAPWTAISLLRGDGHGGLRCTSTSEAPQGEPLSIFSTNGIAVLDVDGDGHLDAVTSGEKSRDGGILLVFRGNGAGGLQTPTAVQLSGIAGQIEAVDLDLDGNPDLVAAVGNKLSVLLRDPAGGLAPETIYDAPVFGTFGLGDVDTDGYPDIVTASWFGETLLLLNSGDGTLLRPKPIPGTGRSTDAVLADFNGDGSSDLARRHRFTNQQHALSVHLGDGNGQFSLPAQRRIGYDQLVDVALLETGRASILLRGGLMSSVSYVDGDLTLPKPFLHSWQSYAFAQADLDEDGRIDWLTGLWQEDRRAGIAVYRGAGDGSLLGVVVSASPINMEMSLADLNADGISDALGSDQQKNALYVQLGLPGGQFQPASLHRVEGHFPRFLTGDYDGDGFLDVAAYSQFPPSFGLLLGDGFGGLGPVETLYTPAPWTPSGGPPIVSDVDGDGRDEAIVSVTHDGGMLVLGAVDGRFQAEALLDTPSVIAPLFARDVAGAAAPDILYLRRGPHAVCEVWGLALDSEGDWLPPFLWKALPLPWVPGLGGAASMPWSGFMDLGRVDGDDLIDVIGWRSVILPASYPPAASGSQLNIWRGLPDGTWECSEATRVESDIGWQQPAGAMDIDGDGRLELAFAQGTVNTFYHAGCCVVLRLSQGQIVGDPERYSSYAKPNVDVNHDGFPDAVHNAFESIITYVNLAGASR